jgi:uncharacterized membrane protein
MGSVQAATTEAGMTSHAAITVYRPREEVERLWNSPDHESRYIKDLGAEISFAPAPGDRGTEIHVELGGNGPSSKLAAAVQKLVSSPKLAKVKDELRRFKQRVETGEIPRSDATPEGESAARKVRQRPAQPLDESELERVAV